jgi:Predicted metal-binding integral membrane protein (DUF2182)
MVSERASQGAFFSVAALVFAASAAVTIVRCASMSAIDAWRLDDVDGVVVILPGVGRHPGAAVRCRPLPADAGTAWRHGLRLGLHCSHCCAGLMAILLVIGVMDLRAMGVVAAPITAERLAPAGERVARAIGSF